jgi:capsular exopolysaccharide synthesis family protein
VVYAESVAQELEDKKMPQEEMVFSDYLRVVVKHKMTVILVAILVTTATHVWSSKKEPVFGSAARIKVQRLETFADFFGEMLVTSSDPVENYVYEITSDRVLGPAAESLTSQGHPTAVAALQQSVKAARVEKTDLIDINAQGAARELARLRCDAVMNSFVKEHDEMISANAREQYEDVQRSLNSVTGNLSRIEAEFVTRLAGRTTPESENTEIGALRVKLMDAQIKLQSLRDDGNYTEEYPEIVSQKSVIRTIENRVNELTDKQIQTQSVIQEYEQKKKVLEEMVTFLTKRLEEARVAQIKKSERVEIMERPSPGKEISTARMYLTAIGLLLGVMLGIILAFMVETLDTSLRSLLDIERTFGLPVLGVIPDFSLLDSVAPIKPEGLWEKIRYSDVVHTATVFWKAFSSLISRGRKSRSSSSRLSSTLVVPFSPRSPATEGYRAIRTSLQLVVGDEKLGAILMTSAGPAEGKSTTLTNLGYVFAQAGKKTLIVNANMRRPTMCETFGLSREGGLSEILSGELSWRETIKDHRDISIGAKANENLGSVPGAENLFVITEGGRTIHPSEWLSQPIFEAIVKEWAAEFDVVLIDGPPLLPVPDSMIMSSAVGRVVLVYQVGVTQRDSLLRAISMLQKTGAKICGLVLNRLHASWSTTPDYLQYRRYYGRPEK